MIKKAVTITIDYGDLVYRLERDTKGIWSGKTSNCDEPHWHVLSEDKINSFIKDNFDKF